MKYKHGGNIRETSKKLNISEKELIDFSANINPLGFPDNLKDVVFDSINSIINYPDPDYITLRRQLSTVESIDQENIILTNGGIEAIHQSIEAITPEHSLVIAPTFVEYEKALKRFGSTIKYLLLKEENDFVLDFSELMAIDYSAIDLVILCNPNNPTGQLIDKENLRHLISYLSKRAIKIIIDESFIDFLDKKKSAKALVKTYDNLIIIRSLTKFYAIPGLRLGFLITSNLGVKKFINTYSESWRVNKIANDVGVKILENEMYIKNTKKFMAIEKNYLYKQLQTIRNLKVYPSEVNFIFFKTTIDIELKEELLKHNMLIRHCNNYIGLNNRFYRVAVKSRKENNQLINQLKVIMEDQ